MLLDQQHALRADGHALLRRRVGLRARPRPRGPSRQQDSSLLASLSRCSRCSLCLNILGLGVGKWINNLGAIGTFIAAAVLIGLGIVIWSRFGTGITAADFKIPANPRFVLNSFGVICFGLVGLELASVMGDEIQDPRRTLPGAVAWGGLLSGTLYVAATLTLLIAVGKNVNVLQGVVQAVSGMAARVGVSWISVPFALMLSLAIAGIGSAWIGGCARIPFVAGLDSYMPSWLGKVHPRYATPYAALIVQGIVSAVLVILNFAGAGVQETFQKLLSLAVVLQLVPFVYMFGALVKFAVTEPVPQRPVRPHHAVPRRDQRIPDHDPRHRAGIFPGPADHVAVVVRIVDVRRHAVFHRPGRIFLFCLRPPQSCEARRASGRSTTVRRCRWTLKIRSGHDFSRAVRTQYWGFSPEVSRRSKQCPAEFRPKSKTLTRCSSTANGSRASPRRPSLSTIPRPKKSSPRSPTPVADDVNRAVAAAKAAFEEGPWATTTAQERGRVLFRLAEKIRANLPALAELECRNTGKPIVEAEFDINDVATCFEYYGGLATKVVGYVNPVPDNAMSLTLKEPVGVAGQIIPWNYPLLMAAWKLAPALAAGCTCVLKPAEQTPLTALEFAKYFADCGLPPGVVNIITGFGETCGAPLVQHPDVNKIAFTGSAAVGKIIVKQAADTVKRVTLELGGKSPNIFFADADFEAAIDGALFGVFINQGEVCSAGSRILVQKSIYKNFVEAMTEKAKKIKLGPPLERETKMGPLVSKEQYDRVNSYHRNRQERSQARLRRRTPREICQRLLRAAHNFLRRDQLAPASPAKKSSARSPP